MIPIEWVDICSLSPGLRPSTRLIALMKRMTTIIFQTLEKGWNMAKCSLIDMKVEFGVTPSGEIVLADVIDNDSWRVWPHGDKRMQLDKQFYRDMKDVTQEALLQLISNYEKVMNLTAEFNAPIISRVVIIMGSVSDQTYCDKIVTACKKLGLTTIMRVCSAHKSTTEVLEMVSEYESDKIPTVIIAVAGRSNGLGPVLAGNSSLPVINCPPVGADWASIDLWSSLRTPSGLGCSTVMGADEAALAAAKILAQNDHMLYGRILTDQLHNYMAIYRGDINMQKMI
uniref:AIRC domain-containing protein n=1 Tax=Heterorhabditis bacteriophora TaxID=37862 RepID=A0A1I7XBN1_HETBA